MKSEIKNGIIILLVVLGILAIVYFGTAYRTGQISHKKYDNNSEITNNDPSYSNMIIYSKVFSQKEEKYMVLFFDNTKIKDSLSTTIDLYDKNEGNIKLYKVNYNETINKKVVSKTENKVATNVDELKIKGTTLITIENGKIINYISNEDEILSSLE